MMQTMKAREAQVTTALYLMVAGIILLAVSSVDAQRNCQSATSTNTTQSGWRVFSPPDRSFTVELPGRPRHTNNPDPKGVDEQSFFEWFDCIRSVDFYVLPLNISSPANAFLVGVFDVSRCKRRPEMFNEEVERLVLVIGGDNKRLISDSAVSVDGLPGREFTYANGDANGRVLIVNANRRIYTLIYETDVPAGASSSEAMRMFRTFHPK